MLIDTHCHLTDERFTDIGEVLKRAFEAGVKKVIMPSTSVSDAKKAVEIAEKYKQYCLVGIHPEEVGKMPGDYPDGSRVKPGVTMDDGLGTGYQQGLTSQDLVSTLTLQGESLGMGKQIEEMENIIKGSGRVVGVGEIGLDFHYDREHKTEQKQRELLRTQMEMAQRNNLPVAIHMRDAEEEMVEELRMFMEKYGNGDGSRIESGMTDDCGYEFTPSGTNDTVKPGMTSKVGVRLPQHFVLRNDDERKFALRGQFHCFAGSLEFLEKILRMGFYVGFGGNITYKSAGNLRELLKKVPLDRLLLETDSPYLPPEPLRGTVNTPANVKITAEFIAQELNLDLAELAKTTSQNAKCLYSLDIS